MRVLSLQSHVVSGYVGNKSAVFPLQVLGFEVDAINSVQFSNHTGYKHVRGQVLNSNELEELIEGLKLNDVAQYTHLLTGYIGTKSFLQSVKNVVRLLRSINPKLVYVCDPVMGDDNKMYVPEDLLPVYREEIIPLADIVTPNQFEAELLSGVKIKSESDVIKAANWFHSKGVQSVVFSSTDLGKEEELLGMAFSTSCGVESRLKISMPRFPLNFTGTGDLFAALLLAWMHQSQNDLKKSLENTIATMQNVLRRTIEAAKAQTGNDLSVITPQQRELKLIQSLDDIRNPVVLISATRVSE